MRNGVPTHSSLLTGCALTLLASGCFLVPPPEDLPPDGGPDSGLEAGPEAGPPDAGPDDVPPEWVCPPEYYDSLDGCDCECGAVDPDCAVTPAEVYGCEEGLACDDDGTCVEACEDVPLQGTCDGDVALLCQFVDGVAESVEVDCAQDGLSCVVRDGVAGCGERLAPEGWTCDETYYGTHDGCDCECGVIDPDCLEHFEDVYNCDFDQTCGPDGTCVDPCPNVPPGGACDGRTLIACEAGTETTTDCDDEQTCKVDASGLAQCVLAGAPTQSPPAGWTCAPEAYAAGDGCDCDCGLGARDPDCDSDDQAIYGCRGAQLCDQQGLCSNPPPPEAICGDDRCNGDERPESCPEDCRPMPNVPGADLSGLPDMTIDADDLRQSVYLDRIDVQAGSCLTEEAQLCVTGTGPRTVLRFTTTINNVGTADHIVGDPEHVYDANWYWDTCHSHHHYQAYAAYDLLSEAGEVVVEGAKQGFFVIDTGAATSSCDPKFPVGVSEGGTFFEIQGISAGCSDTYDAELPCQWIDVTDVSDGTYTLRVSANPNRTFEELDYDNNASSLRVRLSGGAVEVLD